jgi:hypothetical protein
MALDLNTLYQYYRDQGLDEATAAQYTVYYIPAGKKKGFSGITTPKFKPESQIYSEVAPNYTKYKNLNQPFWNSVINVVNKGGTYLDLQKLVSSDVGQKYAEDNDLYTPEGYTDTRSLLSTAGRMLNEYTNTQEQLDKQKKTFGTFAASIGAPSPDKRYSFNIDNKYDAKTQVEYEPVRKIYNQLSKKIKDSLVKAKVADADTANYLAQFDVAFESAINNKLAKSNLTPFTDYVLRKG